MIGDDYTFVLKSIVKLCKNFQPGNRVIMTQGQDGAWNDSNLINQVWWLESSQEHPFAREPCRCSTRRDSRSGERIDN